MENPWGNAWRIIDKFTVKGTGDTLGGIPYINNETSCDIKLPNMTYGWISNMGIGNNTQDWLYMPIKYSNNANSAVPVGDTLWTTSALNGINKIGIGGTNTGGDGCGLFDYNCDTPLASAIQRSNARIMFVPTKNTIYQNNITKWQQKYGG